MKNITNRFGGINSEGIRLYILYYEAGNTVSAETIVIGLKRYWNIDANESFVSIVLKAMTERGEVKEVIHRGQVCYRPTVALRFLDEDLMSLGRVLP